MSRTGITAESTIDGSTNPRPIAGRSLARNPDGGRRRRRTRRIAGSVTALTGFIALMSALTPPLQRRVRIVTDVFSVGTAHAANALVAATGVGLVVLSWAILRGQRRAWWLAMAALSTVVVGHVVKGVDLEEAAAAAAAASYLGFHREAFRARSQLRAGRHAIATLSVGLSLGLGGAFVAIEAATWRTGLHRLTASRAARDALGSLRSPAPADVPYRLEGFLRPALIATGVAVALVALWIALRPVIARVVELRHRLDSETRARAIISAHGGGTLDYFALRDDKDYFFHENSLISYAIYGSVCLVSPDPIGPLDERKALWREFRDFTDGEGWVVALLGASSEQLDFYRLFGMTSMYVGDEAIVDVQDFRLDGGDRKSLRQAVNRVGRNGYTVEFHNPAHIDADLRSDLESLMAQSRRGRVERGFSMTLGRVFDARDDALLLAVCKGSDGKPAAFCQYVPSPLIEGWSLDLMRRDTGEHPNGLLDFVIVETIRHLAANGQRSLGLNFAAMRAVLANETGSGWWQRMQRRALQHLSKDMQIASLWHFNSKYGPRWMPRYVVIDGRENFLPAAVAMARAESLWEVPLLGRLFRKHAASP